MLRRGPIGQSGVGSEQCRQLLSEIPNSHAVTFIDGGRSVGSESYQKPMCGTVGPWTDVGTKAFIIDLTIDRRS